MMSSTNASPFEFTLQPMEGSEPGVLTPLQAMGSTLSDSLLSLALGEKIQSPNKVLATKENYTTLAVGLPELVSCIVIKRRSYNRLFLGLFVCGINLTSGQHISELFLDCLEVMLFAFCFTPLGW